MFQMGTVQPVCFKYIGLKHFLTKFDTIIQNFSKVMLYCISLKYNYFAVKRLGVTFLNTAYIYVKVQFIPGNE